MLLTCAALLWLIPATVIANDSALNSGRYGPEPIGGGFKQESIIEMAREELTFEIGKKETSVDAKFFFVSHKQGADANQLVGFPDEGIAQKEAAKRTEKSGKEVRGPEIGIVGPLQDLVTRVNGEVRKTKIDFGFVAFQWDDKKGSYVWLPSTPAEGTLMAWHVVPVTFPPGKEVVVERTYRVENGSNVLNATYFQYSTHTGAAWKGAIGSLTLNVKLTEGLTVKDISWEGAKLPSKEQQKYGPWTIPSEKSWQIISPTEMRLIWKNFEPRDEPTRRLIAIVFKAPPQEE